MRFVIIITPIISATTKRTIIVMVKAKLFVQYLT
jgi:hypothetical protein